MKHYLINAEKMITFSFLDRPQWRFFSFTLELLSSSNEYRCDRQYSHAKCKKHILKPYLLRTTFY